VYSLTRFVALKNNGTFLQVFGATSLLMVFLVHATARLLAWEVLRRSPSSSVQIFGPLVAVLAVTLWLIGYCLEFRRHMAGRAENHKGL
jgi:hypothetical protein